MLKYQQHSFKNGFRLIHVPDESLVAYFGAVIGAGSRDETPNECGIAHFIEHMMFKGTHKRKQYHIHSRMEVVGGDIEAYTDKEFIVISSCCPRQYYERAVELIADMLFKSTFLEKEISKEKEVVAEEISMYKDSPSELIFDEFDELLFGEHPLGHNILGTEKTLKKISHSGIISFFKRRIVPQNIVFYLSGNISLKNAVKNIEKYFSYIHTSQTISERQIPPSLNPVCKTVNLKTHQAHCIIGKRIDYMSNTDKMAMLLITDLLGGGMTSRLNMQLRNKHGLVYQVDADYTSYSDCGTFDIYFGTDKSNLDTCQNMIMEEITKLSSGKLGTMQMHNLKRKTLGQIIVVSQDKTNMLIPSAKSLIRFNQAWSLDDIAMEIEQITSTKLLEIATEQFLNFTPSILVFK